MKPCMAGPQVPRCPSERNRFRAEALAAGCAAGAGPEAVALPGSGARRGGAWLRNRRARPLGRDLVQGKRRPALMFTGGEPGCYMKNLRCLSGQDQLRPVRYNGFAFGSRLRAGRWA